MSATSPSPSVAFSLPGTKQVTLQVCNAAGCTTLTQNVVVLDPVPHIVSVGGVPSLAGAGQTLTLSATATGRPALNYRWTITGTSGSLVLTGNPAFWNTLAPGLGSYQVQLEVQNTDGLATSAPLPVDVSRMTFADVPPDYWAWRYIEGLYDSGITRGCGAEPVRFCPGNLVSRAEMAVFLTRAIHGVSFVPAAPAGVFADVPTSFWAASFIEQFYSDGITGGCGAFPLSFCPNNTASRAEVAVFLLRAKHGRAYQPPPATGTLFADVPASYWAAAWIEQLHAEGITSGCGGTPLRFCPDGAIPRDQMSVFLTRTFSLPLP